MKHLKFPLAPLLPSIAIYTAKPDLISRNAEAEADEKTAYPIPGDLSKDTPIPISYALEMYADICLELNKKEEAGEVIGQLRDEVDKIRAAYWDHRLKAISI